MSDEKSQELQASGMVEWSVFSELVAMDEDEEGFSKSLFQTFVDQVIDTFREIDENLKQKNLEKLLALGHYLKGLAAALGLTQILAQCERIQNYGHKNNFDNFDVAQSPAFTKSNGDESTTNDFWIALIQDALEKARDGFVKSKIALSRYFDDEF
ncbi:histidine-phosphotransfer domain, HPT domain-containing protein [Suhomyces tanzawaensis NRRL Y-17324]|uniref:Histidine-phosphotransfer domain, HPT domain-containing protein n=1 Tax=Suhomyces tanzawaensis NRRL Y-17324 TaxID=984487 RepID=A0A1E4SB31_9ASCO|nr:histidine-phosphotransfer domain, HPT domain-containing protein [Suhomyces tanzawaensis NRRL Y-17324]ODV76685.1 histidine-phosphotransfer domain, HPT domain-containing protein [Suhomyces tanzawaensis NRRL Y-17324]